MEQVLLIIAGAILGTVFVGLWALVTIKWLKLGGQQHLFGYHIHHSMFALVPLFLLFVVDSPSLRLVFSGSAIGILLEKKLTHGKFYTIEKVKYTKDESDLPDCCSRHIKIADTSSS